MLIVVEDMGGKRAAQRELVRAVKARLPSQGMRNIGFPSGNRDEIIYSKGSGSLWCAFGSAEDAKVPRRWNAFGVFDGALRAQVPTVEINIPTTNNSATVSGFFACDPATGAVYLMHDGGVGGGKPGVGQTEFLAWSRSELTVVERSDGKPREGILIGRVDAKDLPARIWRYVQLVREFKDAVDEGRLDDPGFRRRVAEWKEYRRESVGRRTGRRRAEIDYISYHGDIVDLLKSEREARMMRGEQVLNSPLIDLFVKSGGKMTEIYEVKTSLGRQALYTAIGQLMAHSSGAAADIRRTLVVPDGDIPDDLDSAVRALGIEVRKFRLSDGDSPEPELL